MLKRRFNSYQIQKRPSKFAILMDCFREKKNVNQSPFLLTCYIPAICCGKSTVIRRSCIIVGEEWGKGNKGPASYTYVVIMYNFRLHPFFMGMIGVGGVSAINCELPGGFGLEPPRSTIRVSITRGVTTGTQVLVLPLNPCTSGVFWDRTPHKYNAPVYFNGGPYKKVRFWWVPGPKKYINVHFRGVRRKSFVFPPAFCVLLGCSLFKSYTYGRFIFGIVYLWWFLRLHY